MDSGTLRPLSALSAASKRQQRPLSAGARGTIPSVVRAERQRAVNAERAAERQKDIISYQKEEIELLRAELNGVREAFAEQEQQSKQDRKGLRELAGLRRECDLLRISLADLRKERDELACLVKPWMITDGNPDSEGKTKAERNESTVMIQNDPALSSKADARDHMTTYAKWQQTYAGSMASSDWNQVRSLTEAEQYWLMRKGQSTSDAYAESARAELVRLQEELRRTQQRLLNEQSRREVAYLTEMLMQLKASRECCKPFASVHLEFSFCGSIPNEQTCSDLSNIVAQAATKCNIAASSISIVAQAGTKYKTQAATKSQISAVIRCDGEVNCTLQVRSNASVLAVLQALEEALHGDLAFNKISKALPEFGIVDGLMPKVSATWAIEWVQEALEESFPGCNFRSDHLKDLVPILSKARHRNEQSWKRVLEQEDIGQIQQLIEAESLIQSQGVLQTWSPSLIPDSVLKDSLAVEATDAMTACANVQAPTTQQILSDAMVAQRKLKMHLVHWNSQKDRGAAGEVSPKETEVTGGEWAALDLPDMSAVPHSDKRRCWYSSSEDFFPCAKHFDFGIQSPSWPTSRHDCHAQVVSPVIQGRSRRWKASVAEISRLWILFDNAKCLLTGLRRLLKSSLHIISVDNQFRNPSCIGFRCMKVRVLQHLGDEDSEAQRKRVSELWLWLRELPKLADGVSPGHREDIQEILQNCRIDTCYVEEAQTITLDALENTAGQHACYLVQEIGWVLGHVERRSLQTRVGEAELRVAEAVICELCTQAAASGAVPPEVLEKYRERFLCLTDRWKAAQEHTEQKGASRGSGNFQMAHKERC